MLKLKHKFYPTLLFSGLFLAVLLVQLILLPHAHAVNITCPDGFNIPNAPAGETASICANHKIGDAGGDPSCYSSDGTQKTACDLKIGGLANDKCYTERRGGPNGALVGYSETSCKDATDRDQDGVAGGAGYCSQNPDDTKNCIVTPLSADKCVGVDKGKEAQACGLFDYINTAIKLLSIMVGIVVTIMIIFGGIRYSAAGSDPNAVQKAKSLIFKGVGALVGYGLLFAIMQWLLPGGIL